MANDEVILNQPPQHLDAERAVLGSILTNANALYRVVGIINTEAFFKDAHRAIFATIRRLAEESREIDTLTVKDELARHGQLEQVGGHAYVSALMDGVPDIANVERYAKIIKLNARKRRYLAIGHSMVARALDMREEPEQIGAWAINALASEGDTEGHAESLYDIVIEVEKRKLDRNASGATRVFRVGMPRLDAAQIVRRKALTIVAAPTHHGKTTFLLNLMAGILRNEHMAISAFFSLEMSDEEVVDPVLAILSKALLRRIQNHTISDEEEPRFVAALDLLRNWRKRAFFTEHLRDFESLHADCRRLKATGGLDVIFVDYLQLIGGFDSESGEREVNRIGRGLKRLAQDLDIAVVVASQVNKEREKRSSKRLSISDMKYGSVIGEHADVALMFQRPRQDDKANQDLRWCEMVFQVEKNRGHENGDIPMHADMPTQTIAEGDCESNHCRWFGTKAEQLLLGESR
jgi:replicative DNA helicase